MCIKNKFRKTNRNDLTEHNRNIWESFTMQPVLTVKAQHVNWNTITLMEILKEKIDQSSIQTHVKQKKGTNI